jgi:hypothetical protein
MITELAIIIVVNQIKDSKKEITLELKPLPQRDLTTRKNSK